MQAHILVHSKSHAFSYLNSRQTVTATMIKRTTAPTTAAIIYVVVGGGGGGGSSTIGAKK